MSFQVCHCGWSKMTSYQGLRIHQGKMGCTPMGMRIPESEQHLWGNQGLPAKQKEPWLDIYPPIKDDTTDSSANMSFQVCHCGWSKMTSYQGLRIHQGKMGCTPTGMRIPESEQYLWKTGGVQQRPVWQGNSGPVKTENVRMSPSTSTQTNPAPATATRKDQTTSSLGTDETPPRARQKAANVEAVRRALDFSTGLQVEQLVWEPPTTTYQETAVRPKEKDRENKKLSQARQDKIKADLQQKMQMREQKVDEIKESVKACKGGLDREWVEINTVFSEVMREVEEARQKALQPLEDRRRRAKREAKHLIQELQTEIDQLKKTIAELDSDLQVSPVTGLDDFIDWKKVTVDTSFSFGTLRTITSTMMEQIQQKLEKLSSVELKRIPKFGVDVKLDPTTAHTCLILSDDGKEVRDGGEIQEVPDAPERFDLFGSVLGLNKLNSGKSYWEVEVTNKTGWDLGVARGNANRKGKLSLSPDNGYWVTAHYNDKQYAAMTAPPIRLNLIEKPQNVGVFVDYEEGLVSFYDVKARSHIYSFTGCSFTGELYPYLSPHLKQNEKNSDPLIISAVKHH
ncbi:putative E3 ubiquitin-protein ligase TRIML1 [Centroberyx gerrardi]